ncbi:MAG: acyl-CoA thioesterase [Ignavibacteriae bacterium HGW-Ignavibacteriae-1]|jgi:acyl-CoA thioester hydrolase|nr:MAG: acyl-CoA thioesterase [Ignavibacteriae bacterium HGW-Ignavibacteriae-1]
MKTFQNVATFRVRYADTDRMGFLYNGNYLTLFEIGRTELMRTHDMNYRKMEDEGFMLPLTQAYAKYNHPAYYDDVLEIQAALEYTGGALLRFNYNILKDNTIITNGFTEHIFMNSKSRKPMKPPKFFLDIINENN